MRLKEKREASFNKFIDTAHSKSTPIAASFTFQVQRARNEPSGLYTIVLRSNKSDSKIQYKITLAPNAIADVAAKARAVGTAFVIAASSATATRTAGFTLGFPSAPALDACMHVFLLSSLRLPASGNLPLSLLHRIPRPRSVEHAVRMEPTFVVDDWIGLRSQDPLPRCTLSRA